MADFSFTSDFSCSVDDLYNWHANPGALERLLPPWERTQVIEKHGGLDPGGEITLKMHFGKIPFTFVAHHIKNEPGVMFQDVQHKGPFALWSHCHYFSKTDRGARLDDKVEYRLPLHRILPKRVQSFVQKELERTFTHRQKVLTCDLNRHQKYSQKPLKILISGASGVIGSHLTPFLTTGGHQVWTLVRRQPDAEKNEIYWNPATGEIDSDSFPDLDGIIHLAGEYIGLGRWSEQRKQRVVESRTKGTGLLVETMLKLRHRPKVFLSGSAIGYYGDTGQTVIGESASPGTGFLSHVCKLWEDAAKPAQEAGIRTVLMRMGVGLSCKGGALEKLIAAPFGYVRRFGDGKQAFSWISMDDLIAAILHCLVTESLSGPVNIVSPNPVTNEDMIATVAELTGRAFLPGVPAGMLKLLYGDMAKEILLAGCRASCQKLQDSGFTFSYPVLKDSMASQLGIYSA